MSTKTEPACKMSREEAIIRILTINEEIEKLNQQAQQIQAQAQQQLTAFQNKINNMIGRNDQMRELFGIEVAELQERLDAQQNPQQPPPIAVVKEAETA
jgi:predicted transcriptional regulator